MDYKEFVIQLIEWQAELNRAIFLLDYRNIERYSLKIGRLITDFLNDNKIKIDK